MIRFSLIPFFLALVLGTFVGLTGCGGETSPPPSSTTASTASAEATAAAVIDEMAEYTSALKAWLNNYIALAQTQGGSALEFEDPLQPTDGEMTRAREFIEVMRSSVAELKSIPAPAKVAQAHAQLRSSLSGELTALERLISALDWGSERDVELAYRQAEESYALFKQAAESLEPYIDMSDIMEN
jgi:hypothetical protein